MKNDEHEMNDEAQPQGQAHPDGKGYAALTYIWIVVAFVSPALTLIALLLLMPALKNLLGIDANIDWYWLVVPGVLILLFAPGLRHRIRAVLTATYIIVVLPLVGYGGFALACSLGLCWPTP